MEEIYTIDARDKQVLIISDTHIPFSHCDYISFLKHLKETLNPEIVIHIGDELDFHANSFHSQNQSSENTLGASQELDDAIIEIQEGLHKLFPKMYLLESNHGSLLTRKFKHHGLPIRSLKPMHELYETPLWSWHFHILLKTNLGDVYLCHGKSKNPSTYCKEMGCSVVSGHFHESLSINWFDSHIKSRFAMYVGCLVDQSRYAFEYAKTNTKIFQIGCGSIDKEGLPHIHKMVMDSNNRWKFRSQLEKQIEYKKDYCIVNIIKRNGEKDKCYIDKEDLHYFQENAVITTTLSKQNKTKYCKVPIGDKKYKFLHCLILGHKENHQIDHINGNGLDNRKSNLRFVTASQNMQNSKNRSKHGKGVQLRTYKNGAAKYRARIRKNGTLYNLGEYKTKIEAMKAYDKKAIELFGKDCMTNKKLGNY
jgi:hypothetical protein